MLNRLKYNFMIRYILDKKSKFQKNIILFIFFTILLFIGTQIYHFYGISIDEVETRSHGFMALQHIYEKFFPLKLSLLEHMNIYNYSDFESRNHGVILDLFYAQIETFFTIDQSCNVVLPVIQIIHVSCVECILLYSAS